MDTYSVVIPAYNEAAHIGQCLDAFVAQTHKPFEVIVVDNGSTDTTAAVGTRYRKKLPLRIVTEKRKGRGAARAAGFRAARGSIILSTDADTVVPKHWVATFMRCFGQRSVIAVTGTMKIADGPPFVNGLVSWGQPLSMHIYRLLFGHYWLSGFNFGIRKETYHQAGGFNPRLNVQEDIELSFRVARQGRIMFLSHVPVTCSGRRFHGGLLKGLVQYIQTFIHVFVYHRNDAVLSDVR